MRAMLASCLMAAFFVFNASAQEHQCLPVEYINRALNDMGHTVFFGKTEIVRAYFAALGADLPDDSDPVAIFFTAMGGDLLVTLIEPEYCVRWSVVVPLKKHAAAWSIATRGI
ncbi:hypothetical protein ABWH97_13820 [Nitratireductor sp. ac15]